jgi:hypothetical protein
MLLTRVPPGPLDKGIRQHQVEWLYPGLRREPPAGRFSADNALFYNDLRKFSGTTRSGDIQIQIRL